MRHSKNSGLKFTSSQTLNLFDVCKNITHEFVLVILIKTMSPTHKMVRKIVKINSLRVTVSKLIYKQNKPINQETRQDEKKVPILTLSIDEECWILILGQRSVEYGSLLKMYKGEVIVLNLTRVRIRGIK